LQLTHFITSNFL